MWIAHRSCNKKITSGQKRYRAATLITLILSQVHVLIRPIHAQDAANGSSCNPWKRLLLRRRRDITKGCNIPWTVPENERNTHHHTGWEFKKMAAGTCTVKAILAFQKNCHEKGEKLKMGLWAWDIVWQCNMIQNHAPIIENLHSQRCRQVSFSKTSFIVLLPAEIPTRQAHLHPYHPFLHCGWSKNRRKHETPPDFGWILAKPKPSSTDEVAMWKCHWWRSQTKTQTWLCRLLDCHSFDHLVHSWHSCWDPWPTGFFGLYMSLPNVKLT